MAKIPTRSPTHEDVPIGRLASMGLELEDIAEGDEVSIPALVELAEDRGRPASHYLVAAALATELKIAPAAAVTVKICAGNCQRWGAADVLDHLVTRWQKSKAFAIAPVTCLDRCDLAPACEIHSAHGQLVLGPTTPANLDEALAELTTS